MGRTEIPALSVWSRALLRASVRLHSNSSLPCSPSTHPMHWCLQTLQGIHLKNIQNVKVTPSGPHCAQTEVIATLKNGQEVCLNPEAPMVKKIINKMLNK
uniref:Chemokine interleukin-8-like domain-containing protein n=1 Tax=Ursus maritimus TaxID=29073 RepID=A0A452TLQ5_URSMA